MKEIRVEARCPEHAQRVSCFCAAPECRLPLCSFCVTEHQALHQRQMRDLRLVPIVDCLNLAFDSIESLRQDLEGLSFKLQHYMDLTLSARLSKIKEQFHSRLDQLLHDSIASIFRQSQPQFQRLHEITTRETNRVEAIQAGLKSRANSMRVLVSFIED
jgi:hypothetical protein